MFRIHQSSQPMPASIFKVLYNYTQKKTLSYNGIIEFGKNQEFQT